MHEYSLVQAMFEQIGEVVRQRDAHRRSTRPVHEPPDRVRHLAASIGLVPCPR